MTLLLVSIATILLLAIIYVTLERYSYRILRHLWSNNLRQRLMSQVDEFPIGADALVLIGDTHMADFRWEEHLTTQTVRNLGIPDESVAELNERLGPIVANQPRKVLVHCGGTDIRLGYRVQTILADMGELITAIRARSPRTQIFVLGILPQSPRLATHIQWVNQEAAHMALSNGTMFIDLFDELADPSGGLHSEYSEDGYHLWGLGYEVLLRKVSQFL